MYVLVLHHHHFFYTLSVSLFDDNHQSLPIKFQLPKIGKMWSCRAESSTIRFSFHQLTSNLPLTSSNDNNNDPYHLIRLSDETRATLNRTPISLPPLTYFYHAPHSHIKRFAG